MQQDKFVVKISDEALDSMLLAATETYYLGAGQKRRRKDNSDYVEINGYLWGTRRYAADWYIHVERFGPSISSRRGSGWYVANSTAPWLMNAIMERRAPQLSLLGEVHTHPYSTIQEVKDSGGWEFSPQDREWWPESEDDESSIWHLYDSDVPPLWLVLAVAPLQKVFGKLGAEPVNAQHNVWQFDIGELRFWMHAELGRRDADGVVQFEDDVILDMYPPLMALPGDRLERP